MTRVAPREAVRLLRGYDEEAHGGVNLSNNANLFGPNPGLERALRDVAAGDLWDYPSLTSEALRGALAGKLGVEPSWILTGNGSNDLIDVAIRAFAGPGEKVAYHPPTFSMIPIFARTNAAAPTPVPLGPGFALDVDALVAARAKVTFVVSPNNPTGTAFPLRDVLDVVDRAEGLVVVDEAYVEFGGESVLPHLRDRPNMAVLRTFSKARGLAGLRVGYLVAHPEVVHEVAKVRGPFRLNVVSERAAVEALKEDAWLAAVVAEARACRTRLRGELAARGFETAPSETNFLLARLPDGLSGAELAKRLAARDVWIRDFGGELAGFVRITVGPWPLMERFLAALDAARKEAGA